MWPVPGGLGLAFFFFFFRFRFSFRLSLNLFEQRDWTTRPENSTPDAVTHPPRRKKKKAPVQDQSAQRADKQPDDTKPTNMAPHAQARAGASSGGQARARARAADKRLRSMEKYAARVRREAEEEEEEELLEEQELLEGWAPSRWKRETVRGGCAGTGRRRKGRRRGSVFGRGAGAATRRCERCVPAGPVAFAHGHAAVPEDPAASKSRKRSRPDDGEPDFPNKRRRGPGALAHSGKASEPEPELADLISLMSRLSLSSSRAQMPGPQGREIAMLMRAPRGQNSALSNGCERSRPEGGESDFTNERRRVAGVRSLYGKMSRLDAELLELVTLMPVLTLSSRPAQRKRRMRRLGVEARPGRRMYRVVGRW